MPTFKYSAKDGPKTVRGDITAQSKTEAVEKISMMGYMPIDVVEGSDSAGNVPGATRISLRRISSKERTVFTQQLATLIRSGVPILRALSIIAKQSENPRLAETLENIQEAIRNGDNLSTAMARFPKLFAPVYLAMVRSGEGSGNLQEALVRVAEYYRKQEEIFSRVHTALAYPALMAFVGAGTIYFMMVFVMPRLMKIFATLGQELPLPTQVLIRLSVLLRERWYLIVAGIFAIVILYQRGQKMMAQRIIISKIQLSLPLFGDLIRKSELARFSRTLSLLIKSGVTVLRGIEVTTPVLKNEIIKRELLRSYDELRQGGSFGKSLEKSREFPGFMTNLIVIGEESGKLDEAMVEIADFYERDIDAAIRVFTSLLEPLIILVMGLIVGFIVIAMLLPVFQIDLLAR
ncbi:MAG: type II secretion system F family protein [Candidatus Omnitrophota bacterium]